MESSGAAQPGQDARVVSRERIVLIMVEWNSFEYFCQFCQLLDNVRKALPTVE